MCILILLDYCAILFTAIVLSYLQMGLPLVHDYLYVNVTRLLCYFLYCYFALYCVQKGLPLVHNYLYVNVTRLLCYFLYCYCAFYYVQTIERVASGT